MFRKIFTLLSLPAFVMSLALFTGCEEEEMEEAGNDIEETAEEAVDETGDAIDEAGDEMEDAADDY